MDVLQRLDMGKFTVDRFFRLPLRFDLGRRSLSQVSVGLYVAFCPNMSQYSVTISNVEGCVSKYIEIAAFGPPWYFSAMPRSTRAPVLDNQVLALLQRVRENVRTAKQASWVCASHR
jgi:hypothetical protein